LTTSERGIRRSRGQGAANRHHQNDKSFLVNIPEDRSNVAITRAIIQLAHSLGISVLAEGVETNGQLDFLRTEGCDLIQGYLLGRPASPDEAVLTARDGSDRRLSR
jgi:EAL domain-containing protein (putative c-di-GMP-specific phosphodiesterase class I)